jgi:hypothetical protein
VEAHLQQVEETEDDQPGRGHAEQRVAVR